MEIIIDLREPDQIQPADGNDCSERWDAYRLDKKQILPEKLIEDDETHRPKDTITAPSLPSLSLPSRTPIYDFFMLAAGKELSSEEKILRGPSPRRQFGTNKRLLKNFVSEAEELQQDIDLARTMLENEDAVAAIEYCLQPTSKSKGEDYAAGHDILGSCRRRRLEDKD
jgi:hypothetical protein